MSYLRYLCLFPYSGVHHVLCFCFVGLRLAYPMLSVSLNCPFVLPLWYSLTFILYNYSMLMRSIHDFITLTKKNNIDLGLHPQSDIVIRGQCDLRLRPQGDIVILGQCDEIMYRPKTTGSFFIALLFSYIYSIMVIFGNPQSVKIV